MAQKTKNDPNVPLPDPDVVRSVPIAAKAPVPVAPLDATVGLPVAFTWEPVPETRSYRVELLDAEGELLWTGQANDSSLSWPAEIGEREGLHYWRVVAALDQGGSAASELVRFEIGSH